MLYSNSLSSKPSAKTILSLFIGILLAISLSVFASTLGTNLSVTGNIVVSSTNATSTFAAPISASSGNQIISSAGTTDLTPIQGKNGNSVLCYAA